MELLQTSSKVIQYILNVCNFLVNPIKAQYTRIKKQDIASA